MKKDVLDALKERRSIRKFKADQITKEELDTVLEAGIYAPTGGNRQSPCVVAVQDPDTVAQLVKMNADVIGKDMNPYYGAPTIVLVLTPEDAPTGVEDASCVLQNLMLAAYAAGLGSCWIHREKEMFASGEGKELLKKWGLPQNLRGVGAVALGYADCEPPAPAPRKDHYITYV